MLKKILLSLLLSSLILFFVIAVPVHAAEGVPCFTSASGLLKAGGKGVFTSADCSVQDLVRFMNALDTFFYRLAIVLAVLMVTIGGLQWLMAIGNASKISNAKDTIQQAVLGLILALTAILLFNQIDTSFTSINPGTIALTEQKAKACDNPANANPAVCVAQGCQWIPDNPAEITGPGKCGTGIDKTKDGDCGGATTANCQNYVGCYLNNGACLSSPNSCMKTAAEYQGFKNQYPTLNPDCCIKTVTGSREYAWANFVFNKKTDCPQVCGSGGESTEWQRTGDRNNCINFVK